VSEPAVSPDAPIRLDRAARLAFPDGTMTVSGLRREAERGRLAIMRIAGKDYTTLAAIEDMKRRCLVKPKARASTSNAEPAGKPTGTSATDKRASALAALMSVGMKQNRPSPDTSQQSTNPSSKVVKLR
jgi:hypothetical protein